MHGGVNPENLGIAFEPPVFSSYYDAWPLSSPRFDADWFSIIFVK